jgi:Family of unknown function (DUF6226)
MTTWCPAIDTELFNAVQDAGYIETRSGYPSAARHDGNMDVGELMAQVEAAFVSTADGLLQWDDPHPPPERLVADEEYSRVTNESRWRIIGARADAWIEALVQRDLATVERDTAQRWTEAPRTVVTRTDLVTPTSEGCLPLVVCRSRIEDIPDAGVTLGVGNPAIVVTFIPDCGCDACDSGSQDVIEQLDSFIRPIVTGEFRSLRRGKRSIMVTEDGCRQSSNIRLRDGVDRILADPVGWDEVSGPSWLTGPQQDPRH